MKEIQTGNQGKAGVLVGKCLQILGKNANGKMIREFVLEKLSNTPHKTQSKTEPKKAISHLKNLTEKTQNHREKTPIIVKENYRTHRICEIKETTLNQNLTVSGWVVSVRNHGDLIFMDVRDSSYEVLQIRLDKTSFTNFDQLTKVKPESIIAVTGQLILREKGDFNPNLKTGKWEIFTENLELLNPAQTLPFEIKKAHKTNESVRYKYKYLDHRNEEVRRAIVNRHKVLKSIRNWLDTKGFLEIETPILTAGTDEGAREFIVPSRKKPKHFYTLPQAPQQFKQMLMVGGFEKYFQIARCFRDEDNRGDRQPEFTQLDMELAYASMKDILKLNTELFHEIIKLYGNKWKVLPFQTLTYQQAMDDYGCDRPDLRFGLKMENITNIVKTTDFEVFAKPIATGGIVKCIKVTKDEQGKQRISKGKIEQLTQIAKENGLGGLAYIFVNENELQSPIIKFLGEDIAQKIIDKTQAKIGDVVFFSASDYQTANKALDAVRQTLGNLLNLIPQKTLAPAWIIDFPMFEKTDNGKWTFTHNPFSMPAIDDLEKHLKGEDLDTIIAQQYDIILNGYEIGGGSIRSHRPEILEATFKNMGYDKEGMLKSVGTMYEAFHYGAPPHGGIAWGIDRLLMILEKKTSIREVMAFPKTGSSEDLLFQSPSTFSEKKIREMHIKPLD